MRPGLLRAWLRVVNRGADHPEKPCKRQLKEVESRSESCCCEILHEGSMSDAWLKRQWPVPSEPMSAAPQGGVLRSCSMQDVLRWLGCDVLPFGHPADELLPLLPLHAGTVVVREHQPLDAFYMVSSGCLKMSTLDVDGIDQVTGFALRGDVIGLDACITGFHQTTVVALDDASVTPLARWASLKASPIKSGTLHLLQHAAARELQYRTEAQYLMAPASAEVRVARFLIYFGQRQHALGFSSSRFRLPMGRRDMACYLGLAHETVSRSLSLLSQAGYVRIDQRDVEIVDLASFTAMARATRGPSAAAGFKRRCGAAPKTPPAFVIAA